MRDGVVDGRLPRPRAVLHRPGLVSHLSSGTGESRIGETFFSGTDTGRSSRVCYFRPTAQALESRAMAKKDLPPRSENDSGERSPADPSTAMLLRRARRVADYIHAGCVAFFVSRRMNFLLGRGKNALQSAPFLFAEICTLKTTAVVKARNDARTRSQITRTRTRDADFCWPG